MKKTILALAILAGFTSFAGKANAQNDVTFSNAISTYNVYLQFDGANWTEFDNGNMPVNTTNYSISQLGVYNTSVVTDGITLIPATGHYPGGVAYGNFQFLQGNGVNAYGSSSTVATNALSQTSKNVQGGIIAGDYYYAIKYSLGGGNYDYGWFEYYNNSDSSQIQLIAAYMDTNANEATITGVSHNPGGPVAYGSTSVPEPSTYALFGIGALALIVAYRRKVA